VSEEIREYLDVHGGIHAMIYEGEKGKVEVPAVLNEYIVVKKMLINNSLPIAAGKLDIGQQSAYSHKLIIDKKILHAMLVDL